MKLPQTLEKEKKLKSNDVQAIGLVQAYEEGFDAGALAVLEKAEKLVKAMSLATEHLKHTEIDAPDRHKAEAMIDKALAEWKAWRGNS